MNIQYIYVRYESIVDRILSSIVQYIYYISVVKTPTRYVQIRSFTLTTNKYNYNINTQEELHTQKRMQFDKVLITMGITLESSKIKISIVIALALFHLTL